MAFNWLKKNKDKNPESDAPAADTVFEDNDVSQKEAVDAVTTSD